MSHSYIHAEQSVKKFGGTIDDYIAIHNWFDATKAWCSDMRHRAIRHHAEGIFEMEKVFGVTITLSDGRKLPTRYIGEQHMIEDVGFIPTAQDWLNHMDQEKWMMFRQQTLKAKIKGRLGNAIPESMKTVVEPKRKPVIYAVEEVGKWRDRQKVSSKR